MRFPIPVAVLVTLATPLTAQTVDTLGSTSRPATTGKAKANMVRADASRLLLDIEMHMDIPGPETLTFFVYRHHSRDGIGDLMWTKPVQVNGTGVGPAWYSSGPIAVGLIAGNHYLIGAAWLGTPTYYSRIASTAGTPVSFGHWTGGKTPAHPPAATFSFTGVDVAEYYQRLTTVPVTNVMSVGTGCAGSAPTPPRLVISTLPRIGTTPVVDVVSGLSSVSSVFAFGVGPTLPAPQPILGCPVWLSKVAVTFAVPTASTGAARLSLPIPNDPTLVGLPLSAQGVVASTPMPAFTNALDLLVF